MCIIFASCIFFSYGFTICSVCVINENKNVLKSYYSTSDITTALSRALDYTKNNANKYNFLTMYGYDISKPSDLRVSVTIP